MWLIIISQTIIGCAHVQNELCRVDFSSVLALPPSMVFNSSWSVTPMWLCSLYLTCVSRVIMTSGCVPVQIYCTLVHPWVTHSILFKPHFMVSPMSRHPHMLVDSGALGMTSWFPLVGFPGTLVHPLITHSIISQTCSSASLMSALPHMLVGFGTLDMTSCILPVQFSSTLVYPLITHSVISNTYSLSLSMLVLPHILVEFSLIRCRHSIHIQFKSMQKWLRQSEQSPDDPVVLVQFHLVYLETPMVEYTPWKSGVATWKSGLRIMNSVSESWLPPTLVLVQ